MPTRPSLVRLLQLDQMLAAGMYPSLAMLADTCRVAPRTIKRDLRELRDAYQAPIAFSRTRGGYGYTRPFTLASLSLTDGELLAVCMLVTLADPFRDTPFAPAVQGAMRKLRTMLPDTAQATFTTAGPAVVCLPQPSPPECVETAIHYRQLMTAITEHRQIRLVYHAMSRDQTSTRVVNPYLLFFSQGLWYLRGWCHLRGEERDFAVNRIEEARILDVTFPPCDPAEVRRRLATRFDRVSDAPMDVAVQFDATEARRIRERIWHASQRIDDHPDGGCTLHMHVEGLATLVRWILSYGPHAKPLAPPALVEEVRRQAREMGRMWQS